MLCCLVQTAGDETQLKRCHHHATVLLPFNRSRPNRFDVVGGCPRCAATNDKIFFPPTTPASTTSAQGAHQTKRRIIQFDSIIAAPLLLQRDLYGDDRDKIRRARDALLSASLVAMKMQRQHLQISSPVKRCIRANNLSISCTAK